MNLLKLSTSELAHAIREKQISAEKVVGFYLDRIQRMDKNINSYITVNPLALEQAAELDKRIVAGRAEGKLLGIPLGIKDMLCTRGLRTTAGSKMLDNFIPPYDSTVVARLKNAGAILLGKLNQDEFAMGSSNETSYYGTVKNPWNPQFVAGGSSGGSAAAQAMALASATIGTDTGGSIRQPASFCGVVGFKPTYGRVSRYGIVAYGSSLDQAGPMTNSVLDAALIGEVISGSDEFDQTTSQKEVPAWSLQINTDVKGLRVGILQEFLTDGLDADVRRVFEDGIAALKARGAIVIDVSVPHTRFAVPVYYLIASSEASSNLARYDGVKYGHRADFKNIAELDLESFYSRTRGEGFGDEVKRRIMLGTYCLSAGYFDQYYIKACQVRRLIADQYNKAFQSCDVILSPVATTAAFKLGERVSDPLQMYLNDIFTTSTNLAGLPGMSVPFGKSSAGLPIGIQITARAFDEQSLFNCAAALELDSQVKGLTAYDN